MRMRPLSLVLEDPVTAWELKKEHFFWGVVVRFSTSLPVHQLSLWTREGLRTVDGDGMLWRGCEGCEV